MISLFKTIQEIQIKRVNKFTPKGLELIKDYKELTNLLTKFNFFNTFYMDGFSSFHIGNKYGTASYLDEMYKYFPNGLTQDDFLTKIVCEVMGVAGSKEEAINEGYDEVYKYFIDQEYLK